MVQYVRSTLTTVLFSLLAIQGVTAGPACARRNRNSSNCVAACRGKWGWPGSAMGTDPWGPVLKPAEESMSVIASQACGTSAAAAVPTAASSNPAPQPTSETFTPTMVILPSASSIPSNVSSATILSSSDIPAPSSPSVEPSSSSVQSTSSTPPPPPSTTVQPTTSSTPATTYTPTTTYIPTPTTTFAPTTSSSSSTNQFNEASSSTTFFEEASTSTFSSSSSSSSYSSSSTYTSSSSTSTSSSSSSSTGSSSSDTSSSDEQQYLDAHNTFRAQYGASALTWNNTLASKAQEWANNCVFEHSGGSLGPFGENLAAGTGSSYDIAAAIKSWTDESSQYDASNPVPSHFTQVVWKATSQLGCASAECSGIFPSSYGLAKYVVCEYFAQGNVIGEFAENVQ